MGVVEFVWADGFKPVKEAVATCGAWSQLAKDPKAAFGKDLLSFQQSDWKAALQRWLVVQFWVSVAVYVTVLVLSFISSYVAATITSVITSILTSYLSGWLIWYAVCQREPPCCCLCVVILNHDIFVLVFGVLLMLGGIQTIWSMISFISSDILVLIWTVLVIGEAVVKVLAGHAAVRLGMNKNNLKAPELPTTVGKEADAAPAAAEKPVDEAPPQMKQAEEAPPAAEA